MKTQSNFLIFNYPHTFPLERGGKLPGIKIAYHTYGTLNEKKDNCIWVCHGLTANSDVADWWPHTVVPDGFLDPDKYFIVCANNIGSCYGSTGPLSENPETGSPWYNEFPQLTIRDIANASILLADHLGLDSIFSLIGSSVGGFQALEWAVMQPTRFRSLVLIATAPYASPWTIAIDETQRMAIFSDSTFGQKRPDAAQQGLAAARAIALLTYRGGKGYNLTQQDSVNNLETIPDSHRACTYQHHQGKKLVKRFDVYSYLTILDTFDTHHLGRGRGSIKQALGNIFIPVLTIGITTDIIFSPQEMKELSDMIPNSCYREIDSQFGHDGFLVEHEALNSLIKDFFKSITSDNTYK